MPGAPRPPVWERLRGRPAPGTMWPMPSNAARLVIVLVVLAAAGGIAAVVSGGGGGSTDAGGPFTQNPSPTFSPPPRCLELPARIPTPGWVKGGPPLPAGTYAHEVPRETQYADIVFLTAPTSLQGFVDFVLAEWPKAKWTLSRGEREPGEAESQFFKGAKAGGFRAQEVYCDQNHVLVFLAIASEAIPTAVAT